MKQTLLIVYKCIIMQTGWTGYTMLHSKRSIHESGIERRPIGLGDAVGSLTVQGGLQSIVITYNYSEFDFDFE
jgi:hypothetical protein